MSSNVVLLVVNGSNVINNVVYKRSTTLEAVCYTKYQAYPKIGDANFESVLSTLKMRERCRISIVR